MKAFILSALRSGAGAVGVKETRNYFSTYGSFDQFELKDSSSMAFAVVEKYVISLNLK